MVSPTMFAKFVEHNTSTGFDGLHMNFDAYIPRRGLMGVAIFCVAGFNLQLPVVGLMSVVGVF